LWRIKDAEELIKSRVSTDRVNALVHELEAKLTSNFDKEIKDTDRFLREDMAKYNDLIKTAEAKSDKNFMDVRKSFTVQDSKISLSCTKI
jgi:nucleosome binding factor SPN SPT16 subunit